MLSSPHKTHFLPFPLLFHWTHYVYKYKLWLWRWKIWYRQHKAQVKQNEKGKKTYTHLDFHMLCSQEANIIPWMLVIKQCDMGNCYALSLFRQVFFLLNKPLKGLKYNHSQLSAHKFSPSYEFWPYPTTRPCFYPSLIPWPLGQVAEYNKDTWHSGRVERFDVIGVLGAWLGRALLRESCLEIGATMRKSLFCASHLASGSLRISLACW